MEYVSLKWKRPFEIEDVEAALTTLAEVRSRGYVVFEIRGQAGKNIKYLLGAEKSFIGKIKRAFSSHGEISFRAIKDQYRIRPSPTTANMLKISKPNLSLNTEILDGFLRSGLSTLVNLPKGSSAVIQIILGAAHSPATVASDQSDPNASWMDIVLGNVRKASSDQVKSMRKKAGQYRYDAIIRIGASGNHKENILNSLAGVFRTMSSAGAKIVCKPITPSDITLAKTSWKMPLKLSVQELAMMTLLPVGDAEYQGIQSIHPLEINAPDWYSSPGQSSGKRIFARTIDHIGEELELSISPKDALEHTVILGPTGAGKSTVMLNLIMADINSNRSVIVIDPKADLVNDIIARIPEDRLNDLVIIDPSDETAVGWNPLEVSHDSTSITHPELVADAILAVFQEIFAENWGIRAQDILSAALLTLAEHKEATLMWLPTLLTDDSFRQKITRECKDKIALQPFWDQYDSLKDSERRTMIESSLNKVRQIMFRPGLRNILGQAHPKFKLSELFTKRKIVLVPLNKGLIGADSARLLGSLFVGLTWIEVLKRADVPKEKRHIVSMYIDELQDYISLPGSFADALAQARGLGLAITVAHQYRAQLDANLREGIDVNCRNKIIFGLSGSDARSISHLSPELTPIDFMSLPRYHIYTSFMVKGKSTGWLSAITNKAEDPLRLPIEAKAMSQKRYGRPRSEVEREIISTIYSKTDPTGSYKNSQNHRFLDPTNNLQQLDDLSKNSNMDVVIGRKPEKNEGQQ